MPSKFFRRFLPDGEAVRAHRHLAWMKRWPWLNHPNLWHLNRDSVAGGLAIGLFSGLVPGPLQMLTAAALAIPLKKNLPVALVTTLYTNPFTIAPLYLLAYGYGRLLLDARTPPGGAAALRMGLGALARFGAGARALVDRARQAARGRPGRARAHACRARLCRGPGGLARLRDARLAPPRAAARRTKGRALTDPSDSLIARARLAFRLPLAIMVAVHVVGALGFWIISDGKASLIDCVYMVFITVASIGYGEIVDLSNSPGGRVFNMAIALVGIANMVYLTSKFTAFILEGSFDEVLRRRKMLEAIDRMKDHYIVCGVGRVGTNVVHELVTTERKFVAVDESVEAVAAFRERYAAIPTVHGDASDDEVLVRAGIEHAAGVFAITGDDGKNLLITLAAKHLNPARARGGALPRGAQHREAEAGRRGRHRVARFHRRHAHRLQHAAPVGGQLPRRDAAHGRQAAGRGSRGARRAFARAR